MHPAAQPQSPVKGVHPTEVAILSGSGSAGSALAVGPALPAGASRLGTSGADHRPDIQGLRAVAVIAVVANHLLGWPAGGFVGVDVFFVISGFLITGLLLRELDEGGRICWRGFYRRRARRILPAATVCLVVVVAAAWAVYRTVRAEAITADALWSALFAANWHFAAAGSDYLGSGGPVSPLEHFWSLAVEEQFYLGWPLVVMAVVAGALRTRGVAVRTLMAVVLLVGIAASFAWSVQETAKSPTWAYFSTLSRGWEIAAGALLAVLAGRLNRLPAAVRTGLSFAGLAMIGAAMFVIDPAVAIPGPGSAVPVAGALLVLAAGIGGPPRHAWVLTNPGAQYVGRLSYSLYLWHFPVIVLAPALLPGGPWLLVVIVVAMAALSVASYHLIEEPWRRPNSSVWRPTGPSKAPSRPRPRVIAGWAVVVAVVAVCGAALTWPGSGSGSITPTVTQGQNIGVPEAQLAADLDAALLAAAWPELTPAIDGLAESGRPPRDKECATGLADLDRPAVLIPSATSTRPVFAAGDTADCAFGDPGSPRLAIVAGDSIAISWLPMVQELLEPQGYRVQGLTMSGCPFVASETRNPAANITATCPPHKDAVLQAIRVMRPDIVIISNTFDPWLRDEPAVGSAAAVRYADGQRAVIDALGASAATYVLAPPPPGAALEDCATRVSTPADCVTDIPDDWKRFNAAMASGLAGAPRTTYVDTAGWFCGSTGRCPAFVNTTPTRRDAAGHVVPAYAQRLAPVLGAVLTPGN
jgi:peptidoglycan/LPS O-acetylase OafA/YrhL